MLPDFLTGSYKRYKEDTSVFATWLSTTAQACGYRTPEPLIEVTPTPIVKQTNAPSIRLKGKARKEAKEALGLPEQPPTQSLPKSASHVVNTNELLIQAEWIARCKKRQSMPPAVHRVVTRAISARRRCLDWFQQSRPEDKSNASHEHFIGVLESALELLASCTSNLDKTSGTDRSSVPVNESSPDDSDLDVTLHNRFSLLSVEDIGEDVVDIISTDIVTTESKVAVDKTQVVDVFEVQTDPYMDMAFTLYCFFEDLHRIQDFLKDTWRRYSAGDLELMAASLTSDIAFGLVRRTEEEMISSFPTSFQKDHSYSKLASILLDFQSGPTLHDDFIYNSTYSTIAKFMHYNKNNNLPVLPAGLHYLFNPKLEPASGQWMADDKLLTEYLHEFMLRTKLKREDMFHDDDRVDDMLSVGLQSMVDAGKISDIRVWLVFGASVMLDIWKTLGSKSCMGYKELLERGGKAKAIFGLKSTPESLLAEWHFCQSTKPVMHAWNALTIIEDGPTICAKDLWNQTSPVRTRVVLSPRTAARDVVARWKMGMPGVKSLHGPTGSLYPKAISSGYTDQLQLAIPLADDNSPLSVDNSPLAVDPLTHKHPIDITSSVEDIEAYILERKIDTEFIPINSDPAFFDKQNLIYCGMEAIQLTRNTEAAGLYLLNSSRSFLAISHLINAARQLKLLEEPWKDLDDMVSLHINRLFSGALPTSPNEMHSRLALVIGFPISAFARNSRSAPKFSKRNIAAISNTATSKVLHRYFRSTGKNEKIETMLIEAKAQYLCDHEKKKSAEKGVARSAKRHLTLLEVLAQVRDCSQADIPNMSHDYINMSRLCSQLGDRIAARIKSKLKFDHEEIQHAFTSFDYVIMAGLILKEVEGWSTIQENKKRLKEPPPDQPPQLKVAAKVIRKFIRELEAKGPPQYQPLPIPTAENNYNEVWRERVVLNREPEFENL